MTVFSKVLAVFVAVGSLAFLGFAAVVFKSGPNWEGEGAAEELSEYGFTSSGAEKPSWTAKHHLSNKNISTTPILPKAVVAAWKDRNQKLQERVTKVEQELGGANQRLSTAQAIVGFDIKSLRARVQELEVAAASASEQLNMLIRELQQKSEETEKVLSQSEQRRFDIMRLKNQYAELETELYRTLVHHKTLRHHLTLLRNSIVTLKQRKQILEETIGPKPSTDATSGAVSTTRTATPVSTPSS